MTLQAARGTVSAADLAARIDAVRQMPDAAATLAAMLPEQSAVFAGRGTNEAERLRGYILASFETVGLPAEAVPFVLEELETGQNIYTVAAAARALRGAREVPAEAPELLVGAIERLRGADDVVTFDRFEPGPAGPNAVTGLTELARTLEAIAGADAAPHPCCSAHDGAPPSGRAAGAPAASELGDLALEDQDGTRLTFSDAFAGRPSAIAFFYTRCGNPQKCSLTVTRLARLAERVVTEELDANVAGITYDPGFDRPARLKTYGSDRGMTFSPRCSLLRTVGAFDPLADAFDLGVGFGPVTVNRHRLDLVVLDASLRITDSFERRLWHEQMALEALRLAATSE